MPISIWFKRKLMLLNFRNFQSSCYSILKFVSWDKALCPATKFENAWNFKLAGQQLELIYSVGKLCMQMSQMLNLLIRIASLLPCLFALRVSRGPNWWNRIRERPRTHFCICVRPTLIFRSLRPHAVNLGQINNKTRVRWRVFVNQETRDIGSVCQFGPSARLFTQHRGSSNTRERGRCCAETAHCAYHADKHLALADSSVSISKYFLWWRRALIKFPERLMPKCVCYERQGCLHNKSIHSTFLLQWKDQPVNRTVILKCTSGKQPIRDKQWWTVKNKKC
jgi:hypothetical protein